MKNATSSSYMRIRHYVFDWLAGTKGSVTRLPSSRELAERFEVCQSTVVRSLQELIKERYLTNRPGVGLFSNPERLEVRESKLWGVVFGDGRWAYLPRDAFHLFSCFGEELLERDRHHLLKIVSLGEERQPEGSSPEFSRLSGICWWGPEDAMYPEILRLSETIPIVAVGKIVPGLDYYYYDFEEENYNAAKWMISRGCRKLAMVMTHPQEDAIAGIRRACEEAGLTFPPGYILGTSVGSEQELERMVALNCEPDGIIFNSKPMEYPRILKRDPAFKNCLITCNSLWMDRKWSYNGLLIRTEFERIVPEMVDLLELKASELPRIPRKLPTSCEYVSEDLKRETDRRRKYEKASLYTD